MLNTHTQTEFNIAFCCLLAVCHSSFEGHFPDSATAEEKPCSFQMLTFWTMLLVQPLSLVDDRAFG